MAPLLQPQHIPDSLDERQNAGAAPQITMTITRGLTVYTTVIQLGSNRNTPPPPQPAPTTAPNSPATTTDPSNPEPTYSLVTPVGEDSSRGAVAGAVIGSILGFLVLLWLLWRCYAQSQYRDYDSDTSYDSRDYRSRSSDSYYSSEMRQRGGGGCEWKRQHNRVRKPSRTRRSARIHRRARDDDLGFDVGECRSERGVGYRGWTRRRSGEGYWNWTCFDVIFGIPRRRRGPSVHAWGSSRYRGSNASESRRSGRSARGNMSTIDD